LIGNPVTWLISLLGVVLGSAVAASDILFRYLTELSRLRQINFSNRNVWTPWDLSVALYDGLDDDKAPTTRRL
jgi:hypothetical protein